MNRREFLAGIMAGFAGYSGISGKSFAEENDSREYVKITQSIYSREFPIGEVFGIRFGLLKSSLEKLSKENDFSKQHFFEWLKNTDKKLEITSRLRVPKLRSERPCLDGRDIYDGFFATKPWFYEVKAPLEGSISILKKQKFYFTKEELNAFDEMLRKCLCYDGKEDWISLSVGSKMFTESGSKPRIQLWINKGEQLNGIDETIEKAVYEKRDVVYITDGVQARALNKHYNFSMEIEDENTKKNTNGKYKRPRDRFYDIIKEGNFDIKEVM